MRPALNNPALNAPTTDVAARDCKQPGCFHQPGCGAFVFWRFLVWLSSVLDPDEGARHGLVGLATLCRGIRENSDQTSMGFAPQSPANREMRCNWANCVTTGSSAELGSR